MKLLSLEMQGFKSFLNKTTIDFTDGITAIVGPNGSGKSNIIEAISWVMGETSAKSLRSETMADVIFAGTAKRSAVNLCQVTLCFDNSDRFLPIDADQLTLSRRLSRDGHSDYFINQQPCRLKDIHELFMDSGLGRDSFSVIGQGKVDQILNSKAEERRAIVEEAAGVLKYKNKKREAEVKLASTKDNLDRLEDILYEINLQRESLSLEKDRAQSYLDLYGQLKEKDVALLVYDISQLNQLNQHVRQSLQDHEDDLKHDQECLHQLENQLKQTKDQLNQQDQWIQDLNQQMIEQIQKIEQADSQIKLIDEQERHYVKDKERIEQSLQSQQEKVQAIDQEVDQLREDSQALKNRQATLDKQIKSIQKDMSQLSYQEEDVIDQLKSDQIELMRDHSRLNNESNHLAKSLIQLEARMKRSQAHYDDEEAESISLAKESATLTASLKTAKEDLASLVKDRQSLKDKKEADQEQVDQVNRDLQQLRLDLQNARGRLNSLSKMVNNYGAYYQGVRAIMLEKEEFPGILGTVAELIEIDARLQPAIHVALGSQSQHIIVDHDRTARLAIKRLKEKRAGRATFLPLNRMRGRYINRHYESQLSSQPAFVGRASDLVDCDSSIRHVIDYMLGHIIIAKDIDGAKFLSDLVDQKFKVVSMQGDVMHVGGSISGGIQAASKNNTILSQHQELKQVKGLVEELEEKEAAYSHQYESMMNQLQTLHHKAQALENQWNEKNESFKQDQFSLHQLEEDKKKLDKRLKAQALEINDLDDEYQDLQVEEKKVKTQVSQVTQEIDQLKKEIQSIQIQSSDRKTLFQQKEAEATAIEKQMIHLDIELSSLTSHIDQLLDRKKEAQEQIQVYTDQRHQLTASPPSLQRSEVSQRLNKLKENRQSLEDKKNQGLQLKKDSQQTALQLEEKMEEFRQSTQDLQKAHNDLKLQASKNQSKLNQLLTDLNDQYDLSYDDCQSEVDLADFQAHRVRLDVKDLKKNLNDLGPVQLSAIEEYNDINERYQFLNQQKDDLLMARDDLFSTMDEMDQIVADRFQSTFKEIQVNFSKIFPKMFQGGSAQLTLTDEDHLLDSGIEIHAQPPGKKLKSLNLLSGGERTLTAISLLLSVIQANPIPFVILDEVEAALDDANVYRFSHYLQDFASEDIQFIVITHRRGTMEAADRLYGVVMQEKGVSSLLSVHLDHAETLVKNGKKR